MPESAERDSDSQHGDEPGHVPDFLFLFLSERSWGNPNVINSKFTWVHWFANILYFLPAIGTMVLSLIADKKWPDAQDGKYSGSNNFDLGLVMGIAYVIVMRSITGVPGVLWGGCTDLSTKSLEGASQSPLRDSLMGSGLGDDTREAHSRI